MERTYARAYVCEGTLDPDEAKRRFQAANQGRMVQASRPDPSGNERFFEMLAAQTLRAETLGTLLARKPEIDYLLRLAGTTQISRAIKHRGAVKGDRFLIVVAGRSDPSRAPGTKGQRLPRSELTESELGRVEKAALLNAERP